jgi:hypothetical protein
VDVPPWLDGAELPFPPPQATTPATITNEITSARIVNNFFFIFSSLFYIISQNHRL